MNQELPDGRSNIVVLGGSRFVLSHRSRSPYPYLVAMVQTFDDDAGHRTRRRGDASELRELFGRYLLAFASSTTSVPEEPALPEDPLPASPFSVAGCIECDLGVKQRLLAERSTARRIKALRLLLPVLTSRVEQPLRIHRRAHTNGKGGALPDVTRTMNALPPHRLGPHRRASLGAPPARRS